MNKTIPKEKNLLSMTQQTQIDELKKERTALNSVSPTFCLAKWLQHTIYLQNGMNHSCHHPPTHKIPIDEIKSNPKALHNTKFKKQQMEKMLNGERPSECDYCWRIEDMGENYFSDRIYKSRTSWSKPYIFDVMKNGVNDINPTYMEISFSNVCNFKCAYCSPDLSSKWYEEIKQHGPYPTSTQHNSFDVLKTMGKMPIPHKETNPYVDAFWKWWPELYKNLHTLRLTGGEPLMSKDCWLVLEEIAKKPRDDLTLAINTNLNVPRNLMEKFIDIMRQIGPNVRELQIFTSGEATGKQAEYTRYGLNYDVWYANCNMVLTELRPISNFVLAFMTTINILSIGTFVEFLKDVMMLRRNFINDSIKEGNIIPCMANYLRYPAMLALPNLDENTKFQVENLLNEIIKKHRIGMRETTDVLWEDEINQIERLIKFMNGPTIGNIEQNRQDFRLFIDEYDKRRNTDFHSTFPNLRNFYQVCGEG